jgi:hypothetical protein
MKGSNVSAVEPAGEIWRDVPGYEDYLMASSFGRIKSKERTIIKRTRYGGAMMQTYPEKILKPCLNRGYERYHFGYAGEKVKIFGHHAVLLAFIGNRPAGYVCCHSNGNPRDNRPENLRWDSQYKNNQDRVKHGTYRGGSDHPMSKYSDDLADRIKSGSLTLIDAQKETGISFSQFYRIRNGIRQRSINQLTQQRA